MYVEYCTVCKRIELIFEVFPCLFNKRCVIFNAVYGKIGICASASLWLLVELR